MSHFQHLVEHFPEVALALTTGVKVTWRDMLTTFGPILMPMLVGAVSALILTQYRIGKIEAQVESGMLPVARAEIAALNRRMDQIEHRHDEIMQILFKQVHSGSGYTYLPGER